PAAPRARGRAPAAGARAESQLSLQLLAQALERAREARLHGSAAHAERRCGLVLGEVEEEAARDRVAVVVGEALDGGQQLLLVLAREQSRLGGRDREIGRAHV